MNRNPLYARVTTPQAATGLYSAVVDLDHGLANRTRVYHRLGFLSEAMARRAGLGLARSLGRSAIFAAALIALTMGHGKAGNDGPDVVSVPALPVLCISHADCVSAARRFGCIPVSGMPEHGLICDGATYRRQLALHVA